MTVPSNIKEENIKALWAKFKEGYTSAQYQEIKKKLEELLSDWQKYKKEINSNSFSLDNYTNRLGNKTAIMPGGYLCNFLERSTSELLGSSKPGTAKSFGVKLNSNDTYYLNQEDQKAPVEDALKKFEKDIKPLIKKVTAGLGIKEKIDVVERSDYSAKQILRKLAVLDHLGDFVFMYSDEMIDSLHDTFVEEPNPENKSSNLDKNYAIRDCVNQLLDIKKEDNTESILLSYFLWKYANTQSIVDLDTPNAILYGPPGTGKTYAIKNSLDFICQGDRSRYEFVQFHPSFTYEDFIEGIKPKGVSKDGNIKFELVNGIFKEFCIKAKNNPKKDYYFVVDEINRANLSSVFGEALLCLEKDYRHDPDNNNSTLVKTQYSTLIAEIIKEDPGKESLAYMLQEDGEVYFGIPKNLFFIGMMNDVDKSIDAFDLALRRRFKWIRKDCDYDVIEENTKHRSGSQFNNIDDYITNCKNLNHYISDELGLGKSYEFGHSFFMKVSAITNRKEINSKNLETLFNLHLRPTLKEYLRAIFSESELDSKLNEALDKFNPKIKAQ